MSVLVWQNAFAVGVPRDIYAFHRYTTNSICLHTTQECQFQLLAGVEPRNFTTDLTYHLRSL